MAQNEILKRSKDTILKRWTEKIFKSYPEETRRFLDTQKDQFQNPVRHIFKKELNRLLNELIDSFNRDNIEGALDNIIAIRAVQDFTPSEALSFIFDLKGIIEENMGGGIVDIFKRIDEMALIAFDIYMQRKETIYRLRANAMANQVSGLLRKKGLLSELSQWGASQ